MSDFLSAMAESSVARAHAAKSSAGVDGLRARADSAPPVVPFDLGRPGFDIIAEAKLASPSAGRLAPGGAEKVVDLALTFEEHGAAAVSVLTEETRFAGALDHLQAAARSVSVPVMRKDFLVDPIQVLEARASGASGVLLIARLLPGELLAEMTDLTLDLGMFALVEVFDRSDLETAVVVFDRSVLVGVNCRDLASLEVDRSRLGSMAPHLPDHLPAIAESGIDTPDDAVDAARLGYRSALVGSSLVASAAPGEHLARMIVAGRDVVAGTEQ